MSDAPSADDARFEQALELLGSHRSIRHYKPDPIDDADLDRILEAATRASTSGNMQTYSVIVTKDEQRRAELFELHYRQEMILQAPVLLTFVADWNRMKRWCLLEDAEPGWDNPLSFLVAFADAIIAAQNAVLAAEARGLGTCYMGTTLNSSPRLTEFFELPPDTFPATTVVMGWPDEDPALRARLPIEGIVHHERYEDFDDERVSAVYHDRNTEGWKRYQEFPQLAKMIAESGVKNLAQVYCQVKYTKERFDNRSLGILALLRKQGFLPEELWDRSLTDDGSSWDG
ncbi:MAG: nitroreductase family protein [Acidobacteriota bacterium]